MCADGAPLSELSWPSSLAVVVVSFSGLFAFVFLMLACLCCKKGDIGFKEFDNAEGEEYQADLSPSCHNGPEVYILPLTEVSLPVSKQPSRSIQLLKSSALGRHSLLYLKEIGHGWFGKVLLGEVNVGLSTTQVVVKELKASASVQDQMQFLEEVQPYRKLQHPALLQCLAQCSEVTPYLVVMEFCPLGDLKSYLCSCRLSDSDKPDPLILQRMACDVASGLLHLHKNNFIHSDLAMRNCLLTSEMSVKIGDYGLSHSLFKEDYYYTQDQIWVPLRWIAPELIDEVHGNLLVVDQTKASNIWSLGVTLWELYELGEQPYRQYSDRQVLTYAVREQQLKLPKPQVQFPLAERWYEVMQFCWLQAELRPSIEEVHLLLTYLCAKGSSEAEEDFEERWNALRPNLLGSPSHIAAPVPLLASSASSSFPLLEHFSDSFHSDTGDDLLTVTETSHGLNFEYKWEQARAEQPYCSLSTSGPLGQPEHPGVVPVLSAHSPSVSSEYYIRIEEPSECNIHLDDNVVDFSPALEAGSTRLSPKSQTGSTTAQPNAYWSTADGAKSTAYDSDSSSTVQLTLEPLLRQTSSPVMFSRSHADSLSPQVDNDYCESMCQASPSLSQHSSIGNPVALSENKPSQTPAVSTPSLGLCDPYLEDGSGCEKLHESCHTSVGSLRKTRPIVNRISIDERGTGPLVGHQWAGDTDWTSNHSANNNIPNFSNGNRDRMEKYLDLQYNVHCNTTEVWSLTKDTTKTFRSSGTCKEEAERGQPACHAASKLKELGSYIHLCRQDSGTSPEENNLASFQSPNCPIGESARENEMQLLLNGERLHSKPKIIPDATYIKSPSSCTESCSWIQAPPEKQMWEQGSAGVSTLGNLRLTCPPSDARRKLISVLGIRDSSATLVELGDYSEEDDDFTDITSSIFTDFNLDYADMQEEELSPLKNPEGTPDSVDTINLSSSMASTCDQAFSPDTFSTPAQPKSLDSGYDTENNGSPEFMFKELVSPQTSATGLVLQVAVRQNLTSSSEVRFKDVTKKNTYRDSAYFSDYDTENDKSPNEEGGKFFAGPSKHDLYAGKLTSSRDPTKSEFITGEVFNQRENCILTRSSEPNSPHPVSTPGLSMFSCEASMCAADMSSASSLLELCGEPVRAPLEEAEDEDDSDDSESDEELRTYNIQEEDSEGSDEDLTAVPMVVSDSGRVRHLRSLLKMPTLLTQSFCEELERKKKAVSFFDDVTVYLFDQWEEDLAFEHCQASPDATAEPQGKLASPSNSPDVPKSATAALNRFMVSRFSITHVSDTSAATGPYQSPSKMF
uniref:non-specific serine/threonine protein kinase n=1 Tax=Hippocampus comes TaxID=109280 RepID=A0A3Q2Z5A0_HIPCM